MARVKPDTVGYAVIGLGIGKLHAKCASQAENCKLVAVCDIDEARLHSVAEELGCEAYTDYKKMLERDDIDVVSVCTPSGMHADIAIDVASAGKHVFCEKPLDIKLERIDAMIRACRENGVMLGAVFQNRMAPANRKIRETVASGRLGRLITGNAQVKWYRTQEYYDAGGWRGTWAMDGGGSLMNQSIHTIDLFQWFMGPVKSVFAKTGIFAHKIETEDLGVALVTFKNGAVGTIIGTTCAYPGLDTTVQIHGENGSIYMTNNRIVTWRIKGEREKEEEQEVLSQYGTGGGASGSADPGGIGSNLHFIQIQDMVNAIREGRRPMIMGEEGRDAVRIILAIYESARTGREIELSWAE
ncbi:MAG TPA: Gfo/Idh/MocA family oxidoreductase [Firmicutes bacterium]|nr:Gfo/Idh/MocA family oxidoreductase [Bacillota bacterium]HHY98288.1 Gfo/Idh/MocA family oxidoreductase [Bacillota bacterium]